MLATRCEPFFWRDVIAIVLTCMVWTLLAFVIDPRGDFPLIDDWAYGLSVRALLERGEIRLTDWSTAILGVQACWGALFCLPTGGFSFMALRISTLVAGLIGLIGMYGLMRQLGARRSVALFATYTVGANPIYVCASYTFMTDIPFICLLILSTFLLIRGMVRDSDGAIWFGLGVALASVFIRQIGVAIFVGFVVAYPFWRGLGRSWFLQALLPAVLAFVALKAYERGLIWFERLPMAYNKSSDSTVQFLSLLARGKLGVFKVVLAKMWELLLFLGTYTVPFSLLCWPSRLARLSRCARIMELGRVAGLSVVVTTTLVVTGGKVLRQHNLVYDFGVGPRIGHSQLMAGWPRHMPFVLNLGLTAMSVLGVVLALEAFGQVVRRIPIRPRNSAEVAWRSSVVFLIATCAFYNGPISLSFLIVYDRYLLGILPLALALVWEGVCTERRKEPGALFDLRPIGVAAGLVSLMLYLTFASAATHDYLDWSRVRWQTDVSLAEQLAVPATDIDGGWEYNNYIANLERLYKSHHERELAMDLEEKMGNMWGKSLDRPYRVSSHLATGYEAIRKVPLSPWLPLAPSEFIVSKRIDPSSPAK
jgi:dolichyl-phosphate-mannose-protein mannosyltransferase